MSLKGKAKPFSQTYAKWVEFADAMALQVIKLEKLPYVIKTIFSMALAHIEV